jgi:RNA polymerase sigma factor (sigma-70 family)
VINRAASLHRRRGVERRGTDRVGRLHLVDADSASSDRTGDGALGRIADPAFWAAVRALPVQQRACVTLHYLEDRSTAEIAEILDCRPSTVKVHLHRGRNALARRLHALDTTDSTDHDEESGR